MGKKKQHNGTERERGRLREVRQRGEDEANEKKTGRKIQSLKKRMGGRRA